MLWPWQNYSYFLIADYVFKKFKIKEENKQEMKESLRKKIGQKCCDARKAIKKGK